MQGLSSLYIYEVLFLYKLNEFDWTWFIEFFDKQVSNGFFTDCIFKKLSKNTSLPIINRSAYDEVYWYKTFKAANRGKVTIDKIENFETLRSTYLMILKLNNIDFKIAGKYIHA